MVESYYQHIKCYTRQVLCARLLSDRKIVHLDNQRADLWLIYITKVFQHKDNSLPPPQIPNQFSALLGIFSHINQQDKSHRPQWNSMGDLEFS